MNKKGFFDSLFSAMFCASAVIFCVLALLVGRMAIKYNQTQSENKLISVAEYISTAYSDTNIYSPPSKHLSTDALSVCVIDGKTGSLLYEKDKDLVLPMASTTKIMTAIIALEALEPEKIITINKSACNTEGSSIYLKEGEKIPAIDLIYGLMLESGNDAAAALAIEISGSVEEFASLMNSKAKEWGLTNTNFTNPHGLPDPNHHTTAYELAILCAKGLETENFEKIVSSKNYVSVSDTTTRSFSNHNKLLFSYDKAIGVKTGYTKEAGRCLVSAAKDGDETYICVTLNAHNDWEIHKNALDKAFSEYKTLCLAYKNTFNVTIKGKKYTNTDDIFICLPENSGEVFSYSCSFEEENPTVYVYGEDKCISKFSLSEYY